MTGLIGVASGAAGSAAITGFFNLRGKRLEADTSDRAQLWKRVADLEKAMREDAKEHRSELARMEAEHKAEVRALNAEIRQLNDELDRHQLENNQLRIDLRTAQIEIQTLRVQLETGAGSLPSHVTIQQPKKNPTNSWRPSDIIPPTDYADQPHSSHASHASHASHPEAGPDRHFNAQSSDAPNT